ncbi:unnamed protein product [Rotaria socialis]|uniref:Uncharacterized protein n=1 Tax=Rotaria socialis TaxID=392032 RepID=A0A821F3Y2_9BILA|nr:unnamed protein product [Rotaria socialis]CAF4642467.1 unnamed protein product [Rotaria socialis]
MTSDSSNTDKYQLNNGYSIQLAIDLNSLITLKLIDNHETVSSVSFTDHQCSLLTHKLCDTSSDLYELLIDLLSTAESSTNSKICVINDDRLNVSFPIHFGSRNKTKLWSFTIAFLKPASFNDNNTEEITLDPLDWTETRLLGHQIMDDMIDYLRDLRLRPTWRPVPLTVQQSLSQQDLPWKSQSAREVYDEVRSLILPYPLGNIHPRFWGWVIGTGSPIGILAELITGTMNNQSWGGNQASIYLERQVLTWLKSIMGFPTDETCSGALVSGTSVATIVALAVARKKFHGRKMKIYCSTDAHNCTLRAVDILGIGKENIIIVPTNKQRQIDLQMLEKAIDLNFGGVIVGSAGTVGTGAIDDLNGLADLCARHPNDLWFHIDGAIGAVACCSALLRPLFIGLERADSIAFDLHKWLFVPYECGCILIRDGDLHRAALGQSASYLSLMDGGVTPSTGAMFFSDYGLELARSMKSLKVWMTFKTYGLETFSRIIEQNIDQAKYFVSLVQQHSDELELLSTGPLNIVCFRYIVPHLNNVDAETTMNNFNKQLLVTIQERGIAVVSTFVIDNNVFALRMCITNHRTKRSDLDLFLEQLLAVAHELLTTPEFSNTA